MSPCGRCPVSSGDCYSRGALRSGHRSGLRTASLYKDRLGSAWSEPSKVDDLFADFSAVKAIDFGCMPWKFARGLDGHASDCEDEAEEEVKTLHPAPERYS